MPKRTDQGPFDEVGVLVPPDEPPAPAETRSVEAWGEAKGLLPQWLNARGPAGERRLNPEYWKVAAALAFKKWELTAQVSEADFDTAVQEVQQQVQR